jgi:tRNA A-37 threonylcarbamoyl transferase component Bud32
MENVIGMGKKIFYSYMSRGRREDPEFETLIREVGSTLGREFGPAFQGQRLEDPGNYIYLQTSTGLVSLGENRSAIEAAQKLRPGVPITVTPLAGVLNEVYLVTAGEERFVFKRFTDWLTLKWFTLSLVTLGTKKFSLMGQSRLSNEYGMNRFLSDNGVPVPNIVHVNLHERVLLQEYVDGLNLSELARRAGETDQISASDYETAVALGKTLARIHSLQISIGDSKPENFVASKEDIIYVLDLEQGGRRGDPAWDVAVLLFYSGHYSPLMTQGLEQFVDGFIYGYSGEGDRRVLRKAASLTYLRVFSVWTSPQVLYKISQRLKREK